MSSISLLNNVRPNRHWTGHADGRYQERTAAIYHARFWPVSDREPAANRRSPLHLRLFGHLECVIDLDAEISNGARELRMAEEQLYGAQILRAAIDQRGFRASQCMGSISGRVEPDLPHPAADDPRVLACRQMRGQSHSLNYRASP
jgi:hypothetical protein